MSKATDLSINLLALDGGRVRVAEGGVVARGEELARPQPETRTSALHRSQFMLDPLTTSSGDMGPVCAFT